MEKSGLKSDALLLEVLVASQAGRSCAPVGDPGIDAQAQIEEQRNSCTGSLKVSARVTAEAPLCRQVGSRVSAARFSHISAPEASGLCLSNLLRSKPASRCTHVFGMGVCLAGPQSSRGPEG